jgi:hypothetical protein
LPEVPPLSVPIARKRRSRQPRIGSSTRYSQLG